MKFQICTLRSPPQEYDRTPRKSITTTTAEDEHGDTGPRGLGAGHPQGRTRLRSPRLRQRHVRQLEHDTPVASYKDAMALATNTQ